MLKKWQSFIQAYHPLVHTILAGMILLSIARGMSIPFLAVYLAKMTSLEPSEIGFIIGSGAIAGMFGGFVGGILSDFIGRKKVMIGSLYGLSFVFFGFVSTNNTYAYLLLSILLGLCISFFDPVSKALMGDLTPEEKRIRVFTLRYTAFNIGFAIGPLIGIGLSKINDSIPFIFGGILFLVYVAILHIAFKVFKYRQVHTNQEERISVRRAVSVVRTDKVLLLFIVGSMLTISVMGEMSVTLSQFLEKKLVDGVQLFAVLMSTNSIVVIALQYPITRWAERFNPLRNVVLGSILLAISEVGFAYVGTWTLFILAMVVFTIGEILIVPSEYVMVDRITPDAMRGTYYGAHSFNGFGNFIGPWFGGVLLTVYGGTTMFNVFGVVALLSIFFFWYGQRLYDNKNEKIAPSPSIKS
ncbi:MDR family MFS transporter [Longirhabdus pacifica]|uniref:MDR family MFS transporter n=1 Tax=Longirhabdus pacifica TaxID=2305227 RepID=UPI0013E8D0DA|nr:MFS transporter [Longirhabdus pacifica]